MGQSLDVGHPDICLCLVVIIVYYLLLHNKITQNLVAKNKYLLAQFLCIRNPEVSAVAVKLLAGATVTSTYLVAKGFNSLIRVLGGLFLTA